MLRNTWISNYKLKLHFTCYGVLCDNSPPKWVNFIFKLNTVFDVENILLCIFQFYVKTNYQSIQYISSVSQQMAAYIDATSNHRIHISQLWIINDYSHSDLAFSNKKFYVCHRNNWERILLKEMFWKTWISPVISFLAATASLNE